MRSLLSTMRDDNNAKKQSKNGRPSFCLNEFARLLVLLRDDDRCRHAVLKACGTELSREESDARVNRDSFWGVIATRFNDNRVDSKEDFTGYLEEVDSNTRPLAERSASSLKEHFYAAKKAFTIIYNRWSASGQSDPKRITAFLGLTSAGDYTSESKRTLIIFLICRLGTKNADTQLLQMASKLIGTDGGGYDEGVSDENAVKSRERSVQKRSSTELQNNLEDMSKSLSNFTGYVKEQIEMQKSQSDTGRKGLRMYANEAEEEGIIIEQLLTSVERCKRARELGDDEVEEMLRLNVLRNKKRYKEFCKRTGDEEEGRKDT